ncbi:MAG: helix-turn-helix transcriptional regulator [Flammeovirgaceae bacterium]|nr:helix-turn-helix transcriptional regulator [Flammeovirgaceae bacterium]
MLSKIPLYKIHGEDGLDGIFRLFQLKGERMTNDNLPSASFPTNSPHKHNFFEICIFTEGSGNHILDFVQYNILPKSIHVVSPGQTHLITGGKDCNGYILAFNREFHAFYFRQLPELLNISFFHQYDIPPILNLETEIFEELIAVISKMKTERQKSSASTRNLIRSYLNIFLLKINELFQEKLSGKKVNAADELVISFRNLVEKQYDTYHQVKDYADLLNVTPVKLNKDCTRITGRNASDFILDRIILEAKRHLIFSGLSNKEIAHELSYDDPSYFSRIFRKKTGFSPSDFRIEMLKKYQQLK